uniref:TATA-box binding protein associated factor 5 n=1 Tax=Sus scrofa TaxID=9823 RepID=A0A4X1TQN5_PIG
MAGPTTDRKFYFKGYQKFQSTSTLTSLMGCRVASLEGLELLIKYLKLQARTLPTIKPT